MMWRKILLCVPCVLLASCASMPPAPSPEPEKLTVLTGRVIDGTGAPPLENGVVLVEGERIRCVGTARECRYPSGARVIDAGEGTILPGLIDLHVHVWDRAMLRMFLPAGVTTIRDLHNTFENLAVLGGAEPPAPRIVKAGPLIDGRQTWPGAVLAETPEAARAAVDSVARTGADFIKLYHGLSPEALAAAVAEARRLGKAVTADLLGSQVDALQAMQAGVHGFEHAGGFLLAYRRLGGDPAAEVLDERLLDSLVSAVLAHDAYVVPTLIVQRQYAAEATPDVRGVLLADRVPEMVHSFWERRELVPAAMRREFARNERFTAALVRRLHERGGRIGAGSDLPNPYVTPGGALHQELELLVEAGLPPLAALRAATGGAAEILGRDDLGVLAPGRLADLIVVEGNPAANIRHTRDLRWVMLGGAVHAQDALLVLAPPVRTAAASQAASAPPAPPADASQLREGVFAYTVRVGDAPGGVDTLRIEHEGDVVRVRQRAHGPMSSHEWEIRLSSATLAPLALWGYQEFSGNRVELELSFQDGRVTGSQTMPAAMGGSATVDVASPASAYEATSLPQVAAALPLREGAAWTISAYLPYIRGVIPFRIEVAAVEEVTVAGEPVRAFPVTISASTWRQTVWVSEAVPRAILASEIPAFGYRATLEKLPR